MLYKDLFLNSTILISFICLMDLLLNQNSLRRLRPSYLRWFYGIWAGILGILLMNFGIKINSSLIDLRYLAGALAAVKGGFPASLTAAIIIALGRLWIGGLNASTAVAITGILTAGVVFGLISKSNWGPWRKWLTMLIFGLAVNTVVIATITAPSERFPELLLYWLFSIATGYLAYFLILYFRRTRQLFRQLEEDSHTDFLTGLNNVRYFTEKFAETIHSARHHNERLSIILIDIDHFKKVNDTYGHAAGDLILAGLSPILKQSCRSYDTVSRNGGEEFSVLLPDCPYFKALEIADRIRRRVEDHVFLLPDNLSIRITISAGVATYPETVDSPEGLYQQADQALYKAKKDGRNRVNGNFS